MAWPFDPLTTYVPNSPPAIKAFDLNAFQTEINKLRRNYAGFFGDGSFGAYNQVGGVSFGFFNTDFTTFDLSAGALSFPNSHILRATQYVRLRTGALCGNSGNNGIDNTATAGSGGGLINMTLGNGGGGGNGGSFGPGVAGAARTATQSSLGGAGGAGGAGAGGGAGGAGGAVSFNPQLDLRNIVSYLTGYMHGHNGTLYGDQPIQGGGGGGGGYVGGGFNNDGRGGGGGGGVLIIISPIIDIGAGCSIVSEGGRGGNQTTPGPGDTGGGGGGGGGGVVLLICDQFINNGTISVAGGAGGVGSGSANGSAGSPGFSDVRIMAPT